MKTRKEEDAFGVIDVPGDAYYGAGTQRAVQNFMHSGLRFPPQFLHALAMIKHDAALVNGELGLLDAKVAHAVASAAGELMEGRFSEQFVVDLFQTGSGTSTNMNMNEVIAGRANEMLTGTRGGKHPVHPNDHVNLGQSSNDVIPSALHITAVVGLRDALFPAVKRLKEGLIGKAGQFQSVQKIGRTHLQDAVPIFLGDAFGGYARQLALALVRLRGPEAELKELALGGTAVGNGINTHPHFAAAVIRRIAERTEIDFREAVHHFEAQGARDAAVSASGALKTLATALIKIADDIRWMGSGPRCGLGELQLPSLQPGSSIMPGKVNPVIPEAVVQAAVQVIGNDVAITMAGQSGSFELNTMLPVITHNLLQSIDLMAKAADLFGEKCIRDLAADTKTCQENVDKSLAMATYLVPVIGYDEASRMAKKAYQTGKTVRQLALEDGILTARQAGEIFP